MKRAASICLFFVLAASPVLASRRPAAPPPATPEAFISFSPPKTRKAVRYAFWDAIYKLERKNAAFERPGGRTDLVDRIKADLKHLSQRQRTDAMLRFLRIAHHYQRMQSPDIEPSLRDLHVEKFSSEFRAFTLVAKRESEENHNQTYNRLSGNIRELATAGPEGLKLSRMLASLDPRNPVIQGNLAQDYLNVGDIEQAIEASRTAIALNPKQSSAYTTLASAKYALGDQDGANSAASSALLIDPGDKVAYSIMKLTRGGGNFFVEGPGQGGEEVPVIAMDFAAGAASAKDAVISRVPNIVSTPPNGLQAIGAEANAVRASKRFADRARAEINKGDYSRAVALATEALERNPRNTAALFRRAHAKYRMKDFMGALADTTAARRLTGDHPNPILLMLHARVLNSLDRFGDALAGADEGLRGELPAPIKAKLLFQKAWALGGLDRKEDALHALAQAARLDTRYISYYQEALELPTDSDWSVLFSAELLAEPAVTPRAKDPGKQSFGQRMVMLLGMTLLGGFLVALGLLQVVSSRSGSTRTNQTAVGIAPPHSGLIGGAYRIERKIGAGGMGLVYSAYDVHLQRPVAIKKMREEISSSEVDRERFLSEARTVAALRHPNIVEIHSVVAELDEIYLVFELIDGHTVGDYIHHYKRLGFAPALRILRGTAEGLEYAHAHGVIHRDLKPSNIMIDKAGIVKVMDFGVARRAKESLDSVSRSGTVSGTPPYMAPEQEAGQSSSATDVFALAVCFYELVTGELPFSGTGANIALAKLNKRYPPVSRRVPDIPVGFDTVMAWGLEPDPLKRCPTPTRFVQGFESLSPSIV